MKISRKIFNLVMAFMMVFTLVTPNFSYAAEKPELKVTLDKAKDYVGSEFTASVSLDTKTLTNITGLQIKLKYDPEVLEVVEEPTRIMPSQTGEVGAVANNTATNSSDFQWTLMGDTGLTYNGVVYTTKFKVKDNAESGVTSLTFDVSDDYYPIQDSINNTKIESTIINADFEVDYKIALDKSTQELNVGDTDTLNLTFDPSTSSNDKNITWETSNSSVITVDDGQVEAVGPGTAKVTAKVGNKEATCTYTVKSPLLGISIENSAASVDVAKGQTKTLSVTYNPENTTDSKEVKWESSDKNIVTVDESGKINGIKAGVATITATSVVSDNIVDTIEVEVKEIPLDSIEIEQEGDIKLDRWEKTTLNVIFNPENATVDKTVTWTSEDPSIATVDENGVVTAMKEGTVIITAEVPNLNPIEKKVIVTEHHLESIDLLSHNQTKLKVNGEYDICVVLNPNNCTDIVTYEWKVSDESVISLSENGIYKALKEGKATITVRVTTEYGEVFEEDLEVEVISDSVVDYLEDNTVTENTNDGDSASPQTGDLPIVTVSVVAALALAGCVVIAKKKLIQQK